MSDEQPVDIFNEDPTPPSPPAVVTESIIVWRDGAPFPSTRKVLARNQVNDLIPATASLPYTGDEPEFQGMSNIEVGLTRRAKRVGQGDEYALDQTLDRVLGKPKQSVEKVSVNVNYEDWLKEQAKQESGGVIDTDIVSDEPDENGL